MPDDIFGSGSDHARPKLPKRPPFDDMLAALERALPGYSQRLIREALGWPLQGVSTMTKLRQRVVADWDALPPHQRFLAVGDAA